MRLVPAALLLCCAAVAAELRGTAGAWKPYLDEPAGFAAGAALRIPLARRIAVGPEFAAMSQRYYSRLLGIGSVTADFTDPARRVVGYAVAGVGAIRETEKSIDYTFVRTAWLAGAGVRFSAGSRWIGGGEFRVGRSAFPLATFYFGVRFGR